MSNPKPAQQIKLVKVESLVEDFSLYPRHSVDGTTIGGFIEAFEAGAIFPPLIVEPKTMRVIDGFHRLRMYRQTGAAEVPVLFQPAKTEADFLRFAIAANAGHGRRYTRFDQARMVMLAGAVGLERKSLATAMALPLDKVEEIERAFAYTGKDKTDVPLKKTIAFKAGQRLTAVQVETNNKLGGMKAVFYVNQIIMLVESDLINPEDASLGERLGYLTDLLAKRRKAA